MVSEQDREQGINIVPEKRISSVPAVMESEAPVSVGMKKGDEYVDGIPSSLQLE